MASWRSRQLASKPLGWVNKKFDSFWICIQFWIFEINQNEETMDYRNLQVYQKAFALAMEIFHLTKRFPKEEIFGLTSQIRRSSKAVCSNFAEGYRKRQYPAHFLSKLSDCDMENSETQVWLDFSKACEYITEDEHKNLFEKSLDIGRGLNYMMNNPEKFLPRAWKQAGK